jgi:hypothetical protein
LQKGLRPLFCFLFILKEKEFFCPFNPKLMAKLLYIFGLLFMLSHPGEKQTVLPAKSKITIDGLASEKAWQKAEWKPLDQFWLGQACDSNDFKGRYKLLWDENQLYLLAEIKDDTLIDIYKDKFDSWWDDDCLEVFVDEDRSKGEHQYNHNAFAHHIALDGNVVDLGPDHNPHLYNSDLISKRTQVGKTTVWECSIKLFKDDYKDGAQNAPIKLYAGKKVGFALAYCDNDRSERRENFIGSVPVVGKDKNQGWIDAGIFGELELGR